jgi:hypothetical protein
MWGGQGRVTFMGMELQGSLASNSFFIARLRGHASFYMDTVGSTGFEPDVRLLLPDQVLCLLKGKKKWSLRSHTPVNLHLTYHRQF